MARAISSAVLSFFAGVGVYELVSVKARPHVMGVMVHKVPVVQGDMVMEPVVPVPVSPKPPPSPMVSLGRLVRIPPTGKPAKRIPQPR